MKLCAQCEELFREHYTVTIRRGVSGICTCDNCGAKWWVVECVIEMREEVTP